MANGSFNGIAPGVKLIVAKAVTAEGTGENSAVASAINFCADPNGDGDYSDGADIISLPANLIRFSSQRRMKEAKKLDLYLHWPTLEGYSEQLKPVFDGVQISNQIIFVNLLPRFSELDMSARLGPIYRKFLVGPQTPVSNNLVSQRLDPDNGFINEYLIVEKIELL